MRVKGFYTLGPRLAGFMAQLADPLSAFSLAQPVLLSSSSSARPSTVFRQALSSSTDAARIRKMQAEMDAARPKAKLPRCQCGLTWHEVPAMWAVHGKRFEPVKFYCQSCLPAHLLSLASAAVPDQPERNAERTKPKGK